MLAEERFARILELLEENGSVTITALQDELDASESTIRRDLTVMDRKGMLTKVYGGAVVKEKSFRVKDETVSERKDRNIEDKKAIARYAAKLIGPEDFVYIDAGSTTELMTDFIEETGATYVTNAVEHARKLAQKGMKVYVIGGEFKSLTEAIVGEEAVYELDKYNFTIGFWGTNGVDMLRGFTTPENKEAAVKKTSMAHCKRRFVLADNSKFGAISGVRFATIDDATIVTRGNPGAVFKELDNIVEV